MPRRDDLHKILILGSGPAMPGQAGGLDCSGAQACRALMADGYQVVLVNSSPTGITTDADLMTRTYVEPLDAETLSRVIEVERPDALLPTLGGQAALTLAAELQQRGVLDLFGVEMLGITAEVIRRAEDRGELRAVVESLGLQLSPTDEVLVEGSVTGLHQYEFEIMRDSADNMVAVCSIENVDPLGSHSGDGITVAPALTLTDPQYQGLREAAVAVVRAVGLGCGSANIRLAVDPEDGEVAVVAMNPRVSDSSALASKATGFPIAKIAARLAVGYTLDEIPNDITRTTPACFEPAPDYVVVQMPHAPFEQPPAAGAEPAAQMRSAGKVMAMGRTFKEAFLKGLRSRERETTPALPGIVPDTLAALAAPAGERCDLILHAFRQGISPEEIHERAGVPRFFLAEFGDIVELEREVIQSPRLDADLLRRMKRYGFSDERLAALTRRTPREVRALRLEHDIVPVFKGVDTCAAEFAAAMSCFYSTYEEESEALPGERERVVILGGGPDRVGQGTEVDYCCAHAAMTAREMGYEAVVVNCDPGAVSTDHEICDRSYLEPLTFEDVMNVVTNERPKGVVVQFGGRTPLRLAADLAAAGVNILGTPHGSIDLAEDRQQLGALLNDLGIRCPPHGVAHSAEEAREIAARVGFPLLVRRPYVRGDHGGQIVCDEQELSGCLASAVGVGREHPVLIDGLLEDAVRVAVDALADGERTFVAAVIQHLEEAGVRSVDSAWVIPPVSLGEGVLEQISRQTTELALALGVRGLLHVQFAVRDHEIHLLEVRLGAARTVSFTDKAIGIRLAKLATRILLGERLSDLGLPDSFAPEYVSVRQPVLPFVRLPDADPRRVPEVKPAGEVMGVAATLPAAFRKAQAAAGAPLPASGTVLLSAGDTDKAAAAILGQRLQGLGFHIVATSGTARTLLSMGVEAVCVNGVGEGGDHVIDRIDEGRIDLVITTPHRGCARSDHYEIRRAARRREVPCITTLAGASAAVSAMEAARRPWASVSCLQDLHGGRR